MYNESISNMSIQRRLEERKSKKKKKKKEKKKKKDRAPMMPPGFAPSDVEDDGAVLPARKNKGDSQNSSARYRNVSPEPKATPTRTSTTLKG